MTAISPSPDDIHPRRPIVAALLSLALPGLGQLYNGEVNKALWLFLGFVLIGAPGETIAALYVPAALMLPLLVLCVLLDVRRLALRHRRCMALGEEPPDLHAPGMAGERALRPAIYHR